MTYMLTFAAIKAIEWFWRLGRHGAQVPYKIFCLCKK